METVGFTRMADGTAEDYDLLDRYEEEYVEQLPDRMMEALERLRTSFAGYQVTRYEHSLQSATRALRDGRDEEYVVAALLHDIGDELAPYTHGEMVAAILKPYVRPELCWIVKHHGVFQMYYYAPPLRRRPQRARPLPRPRVVRSLRRVLRAVRPELLRPGLRLATGGRVPADRRAGLLRDPLPRDARDVDLGLGVLPREVVNG